MVPVKGGSHRWADDNFPVMEGQNIRRGRVTGETEVEA